MNETILTTDSNIKAVADHRFASIDALLFDMDGVLIDSMQGHFKSWQHAFAAQGIDIEWEPFALLEGQSFRAIAEQLCRSYGLSVDQIPPVADLKNKYYLNHHLPKVYDGVMDLLTRCIELGFKTGLVTGAHKDRIAVTVPDTLIRKFHTVITADDVEHTKPHPEPYLKAAQNLGRSAPECIVFENAPLGIRAAKTAGMICFAVTTTLDARHLSEADKIFSTVNDACRYFLKAKQLTAQYT